MGSAVPSVWPVGACDFFCKLSRGGTCHEPRVAGRPATGTHSRSGVSARPSVPPRSPIGPAVRALCPEMLGHTHRHTDKHDPANFFSPTHRRKSSFIRTCYAKALAPSILYSRNNTLHLRFRLNFAHKVIVVVDSRGENFSLIRRIDFEIWPRAIFHLCSTLQHSSTVFSSWFIELI